MERVRESLMRRLLLVLCLLSLPAAAQGAVAFDANATADCVASGRNLVTGLTCATLTVGGGTLRAAICAVDLSLQTPTTEVMTWDLGGTNQLMTLIGGANTPSATGRAELWGVVAPTSGAKTAKYTGVGTSDIVINCTAWTGVDQTGGATSFPHFVSATATSQAISVTVTSATANATVTTNVNDTNTVTLTSATTATFNDFSAATITAAGSRSGGAASVAHTWTLNGGVNGNWAAVGSDLLADAGGGCPASPTLALLGVGNCGG